MNLCGTVKIETKRLLLRRINLNDVEDMYNNWASDENVTKNLTWPTHKSIDITKKVIGIWQEEYEKDDTFQWAIELKESKEVIGCISAVKIDENIEEAVLGYCLGSKFWNKGIMTEALGAVIKFFFEVVKANRIEAYYKVDNTASGRVMVKCNMINEGIRRSGSRTNTGEYCDVNVYSILKKEYEALREE